MNIIQKSFICILVVAYIVFSIFTCVKVHKISSKEIQEGYFIGTIVDKGETNGKCSYRWIIADWKTSDGKDLGRSEINAGGMPINQLKIGDVITSEASNDKGFFWFNVSSGLAYCPSQIGFFDSIIVILFQIGLWILVLVLLITIWQMIGKINIKLN